MPQPTTRRLQASAVTARNWISRTSEHERNSNHVGVDATTPAAIERGVVAVCTSVGGSHDAIGDTFGRLIRIDGTQNRRARIDRVEPAVTRVQRRSHIIEQPKTACG